MHLTTVIVSLATIAGLTSAGVLPSVGNKTSLPTLKGFGFSNEDMETALIAAMASGVSESGPEPETFALMERGMPPDNRLLAEQIEHDGLPGCYQGCMRKHDRKSSMHMGKQVLPDHPAVSTRPLHVKRWSAREDPDRPRLPYMPGFTVRIESHAARPPFADYGAWPRRDLSDVDLNTVTQSALIRETAQLTVTSYIRIGSASGAQVVVCTVEQPGKPPSQAVAKIFDAMYYGFADDPAPYPRDVTARADMDYAAEAAAYHLLASIGETGASAPAYYGGGLPLTPPLTIYANSGATTIPRVVLVDYITATVYSHTTAGTRPWQALARPMNPMQCFWTWSPADDFEGWVPREWHNSQRLIQEWLVRRFGGEEQRALYEPLAKELEFSNY
ncbi:hypothetical protein VP1G_03076 [Cytospora mali]|uniref:Uncharacterized protein n=1 Tax=Cytospora mali TaxID=578113 RepID=A0A194UV73_CYTMA|nr:hypothetical protein VP1G_03076 [Valsa mali var. pyri (nom. inval.)]